MSNLEMFEAKANEAVEIYKNISDATSLDKDATVKFINKAYNCMNMMNKLIAISINDIKVEQKKEDNPTEYEEIEPPKTKDIRKRVTPKEEVKEENDDIKHSDDTVDTDNGDVPDSGSMHSDDDRDNSVDAGEETEQIGQTDDEDSINDEETKKSISEEEAKIMDKKLDALANATKALGEVAKDADLVKMLGGELDTRTQEQKDEDYEKFMEFVAEWEDKEIIELLEHEVSCWGDGVKTKKGNYIAGIKDLLAIDKMVEQYEFISPDREDFYDTVLATLGEIQHKKPEQIEKNIQTVINKADFTNSPFLGLIQAIAKDNKKPDVELLIREFADFYAEDDEEFES